MGMRGRGDFGSRGDGRGGGFGGRGKLNVADNTLIMIAVIIMVVCHVIICRDLCFAHFSLILFRCFILNL
jgi:hypothetical protein